MQSRKLVFAVLTGFACLAVWPGALAVGPCAEGAKVQYPEGGTRQEGSQRENQRTRGRRQGCPKNQGTEAGVSEVGLGVSDFRTPPWRQMNWQIFRSASISRDLFCFQFL
jgi:hypothetical protein